MKVFRRRSRPRTSPPASHANELTTLCWLLQPATTRPVAPVELVLDRGQLKLRGVSDAPVALPTPHALDRLAQIDVWGGRDVDLLFVESGSSLSLTSVRFPSDESTTSVLTGLRSAYEAHVGAAFPHNWVLVHASRDSPGD